MDMSQPGPVYLQKRDQDQCHDCSPLSITAVSADDKFDS